MRGIAITPRFGRTRAGASVSCAQVAATSHFQTKFLMFSKLAGSFFDYLPITESAGQWTKVAKCLKTTPGSSTRVIGLLESALESGGN